MHIPADKCRKLDAKATEVTFIGYESGSKGYRLWNRRTRSVHLSRDVTFDESSFPSLADQDRSSSTPTPILIPVVAIPNPIAKPQDRAPSPTSSHSSEDAVDNILDRFSERPVTPPPKDPPPPVTPEQRRSVPRSPPTRVSATRIEHRSISPDPQLLGGFDNRLQRQQLITEMDRAMPRRSARVPRPNPRYIIRAPGGNQRLSYAELLAAAHIGRDPASYAEAMGSDNVVDWLEACRYEISALDKNKTWDLVDLPDGRKAVKSKWVFKLKADSRYRARLVAKGFTQIPGIDYDETFSPVARFESLRLLIALAALEDWEIHQLDVKSAFLNGVLEEEIYMEQPEGFIMAGQETKVCRLKKAIYGLKQASRAWNQQFHGVLIELGFTRIYADAGVYVNNQRGDDPLFLILYVDDITIMGASLEAIKRLKDNLKKRYEITDLGEIASYLGIRITCVRSEKRIEIDQYGYVKDILDRFGMSDANPSHTPLPTGAQVDLVKYDGQATLSEIRHYQSLIGSLLYVQIGTRPDISFAVSRLAQYATNPSPQQLRLAKYVLSYLLGTMDMRICYDGADGEGLYGYTDSSHTDQTDD